MSGIRHSCNHFGRYPGTGDASFALGLQWIAKYYRAHFSEVVIFVPLKSRDLQNRFFK